MKQKLFNLLAILSMTITLTVIGLLASMAVTGKLTGHNLDLIAKVLRGEKLTGDEQAAAAGVAVQPAAAATEQINKTATDSELRNLQILRRQQELEYMNNQLIALRKLIEQEREQLRQARLEFQRELLAAQQQAQSAGFRQQLKLLETMSPGQAKEAFMTMDEQEATAYLRAMNSRTASRVLSQFRTSSERQRLQRLLELLRAET